MLRIDRETARRLGVKDLPARSKKKGAGQALSHLVEELKLFIREARLPAPEQEVVFHETRKWRFDLAWTAFKVAVECEGGSWKEGRHTRGGGYEGDCEKHNEANLAEWMLLRFTIDMIRDGRAIAAVKRALEARGWNP